MKKDSGGLYRSIIVAGQNREMPELYFNNRLDRRVCRESRGDREDQRVL